MPSKCTKCGSEENYNPVLNIGLCDPCIGARLEELEAELEKHRWISVDEGLPDTGQFTLVLLESGNIIQACDVDWVTPSTERYMYWKPIIPPKEQDNGKD